MPVHSADAIVLRTYRYGEADRIVVFLTEDRGKKRGVAKNATASRRRFGAALEPFTQGRATYVERENRELVRLDRIDPKVSPLAVTFGREAGDAAQGLGQSAYFAELLDEWAPDGLANERLFRLGAAVGAALAERGSIDALARYFEYWLLRLEGVYPDVRDLEMSGEAFDFVKRAHRWTPTEVMVGGTAGETLRELERVHQRLITMHLERSPRSARVVKELGPPL
jgi:DNA repair protein RecO (recombination protein O)